MICAHVEDAQSACVEVEEGEASIIGRPTRIPANETCGPETAAVSSVRSDRPQVLRDVAERDLATVVRRLGIDNVRP